jgi:hypothetical protein
VDASESAFAFFVVCGGWWMEKMEKMTVKKALKITTEEE